MSGKKRFEQSAQEGTAIRESMVGFVAFRRQGDPTKEEGLLKVTESERGDGSGYLTLTFILDAEGRDLHGRQLAVLDEAGLRNALGPRFEMAMDLPLRGREPESSHWIEEIDLFFRPLDPFPGPFLSEVLLPVLARQLKLEFETVSDWVEHPALETHTAPPSLSIWQRLLKRLRLA